MKILLAAAALFGLFLSGARADTEFDYVGNNFSSCFNVNIGLNSNCYGSRITGNFVTTLSGSALDNLTDVDIENTLFSIDDVVSFSFTDGLGLTLTQANTDSVGFQISTDSEGNITKWVIIVQQVFGFTSPYQNDLETLSAPASTVGTDLSHHCANPAGPLCKSIDDIAFFESYPQGTWSRVSADVPEPGTLAIAAGGIIGVAIFRRRKAKRVRQNFVA